jgi:hypothetical protein
VPLARVVERADERRVLVGAPGRERAETDAPRGLGRRGRGPAGGERGGDRAVGGGAVALGVGGGGERRAARDPDRRQWAVGDVTLVA